MISVNCPPEMASQVFKLITSDGGQSVRANVNGRTAKVTIKVMETGRYVFTAEFGEPKPDDSVPTATPELQAILDTVKW